MTKLGAKYIGIVLVLYIMSRLTDNVVIHSYVSLAVIGLVLLLVNMTVKPLLMLLSIPFILVTFGLFALIISAVTLVLADALVPGIMINGFFTNVIAATLIMLTQSVMKGLAKD